MRWSGLLTAWVVLVLLLGLWARSRWATDDIQCWPYAHEPTVCTLTSTGGVIGFEYAPLYGDDPPADWIRHRSYLPKPYWTQAHSWLDPSPLERATAKAGFLLHLPAPFDDRDGVVESSGSTVAFPYWFVSFLAGWAAFRGTTRMVRARRHDGRARTACCATCGYDLRATPDRCPECGHRDGSPMVVSDADVRGPLSR